MLVAWTGKQAGRQAGRQSASHSSDSDSKPNIYLLVSCGRHDEIPAYGSHLNATVSSYS